jgi:hypothetical protein
MYLDSKNLFSDAQAITVTALSTNVIDMSAVARDIGVGHRLFVAITCSEAFTAVGAGTLTITIETDDNAALTSSAVIFTTVAIGKAALTLNMEPIYLPLPPGAYERFLRLNYTVATGPMTAGKLTAALVTDIQRSKAYPGNFVTA